jgi:DNA-binding NarL/FixJ family response regulator
MVARPLAASLHEWWLARLRNELLAQARLTRSDLVLLEHERNGDGSKRIADALGRTTASVDSQFQRLIAKLRVHNRKDAARLAAEYGLI